jgi:intein-encoded DNA endonuclease-like protein
LKKRLLKQKNEFEKVRAVVDLYNRGYSRREIAKELGVGICAVSSWLSGKHMPKNISFARAEFYKRLRKPIVVPKKRYADFAYILGAYFGNACPMRGRGSAARAIVVDVTDKEFAYEFMAKSKKVFGKKVLRWEVPSQRNRNKLYVGGYFATDLMQLLNSKTNYGTAIPHEYLESQAAKLEFTRALYDSSGQIRYAGPANTMHVIIKLANPEVRDFISGVLKEFGIKHAIRKGGAKIAIGKFELPKFKSVIGFRAKRKQDVLPDRV